MTEHKTLDQLADELEAACDQYHDRKIMHVASGAEYRIVGVHFRAFDMAICVEYTPIQSSFHNRVKFARSIDDMGFDTRFYLAGNEIHITRDEMLRNIKDAAHWANTVIGSETQ